MDFVFRRSYRGRLQAVILDWAGTTMGTHKKVHIRKISQIPAVAERWTEVHGQPPDESDVVQMFE